jgi:predicted amidohydrolase
MKIAVAQISCSLGDPEANLIKVRDFSRLAKEAGAELIDPRGVVIAAASADREELIQAETLEDAVKSVRGQMEVFAHRRPDVYR